MAKTAHPIAHPQPCFWYLKLSFLRKYSLCNQGLTGIGLATNQKVGSSTLSGRTIKSTVYSLNHHSGDRPGSNAGSNRLRIQNLIHFGGNVPLYVRQHVGIGLHGERHLRMP